MIDYACLCGRVRLTTDRKPDQVTECNCGLCAKTGARWGYYDPSEVSLTGETASYVREDKADPNAIVHFCATCGATTHFRLTPAAVAKHGDTLMGVNTRLADERALAGVEVLYPDGRAWEGEGAFGYVRAPGRIGEG